MSLVLRQLIVRELIWTPATDLLITMESLDVPGR